MGLLDRVLQEEKKQQQVSGLLKRANSLRNPAEVPQVQAPVASVPEAPTEAEEAKKKIPSLKALKDEEDEEPDPERGLRQLLRELADLKASVEYPAQFFQVVKKNLTLRKGALLLPEKDSGTLAPWVITGYDKTTEHRMRIPVSRMYDFFQGSDLATAVVEKEAAASLAPYFSSREEALLSRMLLAGFFFEEKIIAVLLISDSPYLTMNSRELGIFFAALEERASSVFFASREVRMRKTREPENLPIEQFQEKIRELREGGNRTKPIAVLALNAVPIIEKIREFSQDLDEFRSFQDLASVTATILSGYPLFVSTEKKRILLAVDEATSDVELLLHQLTRAIRKFFLELENGPDLDIRRKNYPDDDSDPEALTSSLLG